MAGALLAIATPENKEDGVRFISKSAKFQLQVRPMIVEAYATGMQSIKQKPIYCDFQLGGLTTEEETYAISMFAFEGGFQEQDEVTMTHPRYRLSLFDTDYAAETRGWTADEKAHVEEMLIHHATYYTDVIVMPEKRHVPPWPRYDEYKGAPSALVRKLVDEGHDIEETLAYERQNQNRQPYIEALEQALEEITEGEVVEEVVG